MNQNIFEDQVITILSEVNEIFAKTEIKQKYTNVYEFPIEIKLQFPILPDYNLIKFIVTLDKQIIISKILERERGKEKYNDEIASGNTAFYGSIFESGEKMEINIGNLLPKKTIEIKAIYLQNINSEDMSYCFSLIQLYPVMIINSDKIGEKNIIMKGIKCNIYLTTQSSLTRFILLNKRKDIKYTTDFSQSLTYVKIFFEKINESNQSFKSLPYSTLKILFRTENMHIPVLYSQYNEEKDETSFLIRYMYSNINIPSKLSEKLDKGDINDLQYFNAENFIDLDQNVSYYDKYGIKFKNGKSYPSCFIFLIDQSGSMIGERIEILKTTLIYFLKSLTFGSYFQLIGFGSQFIKYMEEPILYNKENINKIIKVISNLQANLVLTFLKNPLKDAFEQKVEINLPKNIIIITDGKIFDAGDCINIIKQNNNNGILHCIGIGEDYNKYFIEEAAKLGKGLKFFISNIQNLFYDIFKLLNIFSQKYLQNINIDILNYKEYFFDKKYNTYFNNYFITQNDIISYGFICPKKFFCSEIKKTIQAKINFDNDIKETKEININEIEILNNGDELGKIIVGSLINNSESNKKLTKDEIIKLSQNYEVLSNYTCFFGSVKNEAKNKKGLININQFYVPDDKRPNVKISYPKTGKHGHAKKIKTVLNEEEIKCSQLIEENFDNSEKYGFDMNNEEMKLIKKIIDEQGIEDGSWGKKIFNDEKYLKIFGKISDYFKKEKNIKDDLLEKVCCTYFIIYILNEYFERYVNIWNQITQKGLYFLQINGIEYDKVIIENLKE